MITDAQSGRSATRSEIAIHCSVDLIGAVAVSNVGMSIGGRQILTLSAL